MMYLIRHRIMCVMLAGCISRVLCALMAACFLQTLPQMRQHAEDMTMFLHDSHVLIKAVRALVEVAFPARKLIRYAPYVFTFPKWHLLFVFDNKQVVILA